MEKIKLGISKCLLGENVRYNGGHALDRFLRDTLGRYVTYLPVCPEVECGFGVPRESMRLEGDTKRPRLVTSRTKTDMTDRMLNWAAGRVKELEGEELCGFVFKKDSPSSGMERVRVYSDRGIPAKNGVGLFARAFMDHFPLLPVEEEGRLHDPGLRENFIERVFIYWNWRDSLKKGREVKHLVDFHTRHKYLIMAHSPKHLSAMGKIVAGAKDRPFDEVITDYQELLIEAMRLKASVKKNVNVLHHIMGYFKKHLSPDEKRELLDVIEHYHSSYVPLVVPVTLINHYVRKYDEPYLKSQYYLNPHPVELQLRNHV